LTRFAGSAVEGGREREKRFLTDLAETGRGGLMGRSKMEGDMEFSKDDLLEARRQIESTLHKLRGAAASLQAKERPERYRSQVTLALRRIRAFEVADRLIENELSRMKDDPNKRGG